MDAEMQEKIFDPFFTTHGLGRGLGLAAIHGIVKSHHGHLKLESELGRGTTFTVYFPASSRTVQIAEKKKPNSDKWSGSGTVLIVDDEAMVRSVIERNLVYRGFDVLIAHDGVEAVEIFRKHHESISLVVLDLSMPRMGGREALSEMRRICSGTPVILTSGFNPEEVAGSIEDENLAFLHKPFLAEGLIEKVRESLER